MIKVVSTRHAGYLSDALDVGQRALRIKWAMNKLKEIRQEHTVHAIVVRGISGMAVGTIVSFLSELPLIVLRKNTEDCHSSYNIEANFSIKDGECLNLVVVDDLISTGSTMNHICYDVQREVKRLENAEMVTLTFRFVGILLYGYSGNNHFTFKSAENLAVDTSPIFGFTLDN